MQQSLNSYFTPTPTFSIALGSTNAQKLKGVVAAFSSAEVKTCNVDMQINQPFDKATTESCAILRAQAAREKFPECDLFVGIQNGIWDMDVRNIVPGPNIPQVQSKYANKWDGACIHLFGKGLAPISLWTREVIVVDYFDKGKNGEWSNMSDPHFVVSSVPRSYFVQEALQQYLFSFFLAALKTNQQ